MTIPTHEAFRALTIEGQDANYAAQVARTDVRLFTVECGGVEVNVLAPGLRAAAVAFARSLGKAFDGVSEGVYVSLRTGETRFAGTIAGRQPVGATIFDVRPQECANVYTQATCDAAPTILA